MDHHKHCSYDHFTVFILGPTFVDHNVHAADNNNIVPIHGTTTQFVY